LRTRSRKWRAQLVHTCTIQKRTAGTADSHGQPAITYPNLATGVACLFMPRAHRLEPGQEVADRTKEVLVTDWTLWMAYRADVTEGDRVATIADAAGTTLEAGPFNIRLIKDAAGRQHHLELHLERVGS